MLLERHVIDSLAVVPELPPEGPVLDVGTGAGFPGIVLACACPERMLVLLEPRRRPTSFLLEVSRTVPLPNVRVVEARAQDACRDPALAGAMAVVVSRAVKLESLLDIAPPFMRRDGGILVAMQSQSLGDQSAREIGLRAGMKLLRVQDYRLPGGESRRLLVFGRG
jgi:16S rRNA (guanine527-N7)-methyltransferase